jgi:hypothetical protein
MIGISAASRGWHPCACVHLFVFLFPCGGRVRVCGGFAVFCRCLWCHQHLAADLQLLWTEGPKHVWNVMYVSNYVQFYICQLKKKRVKNDGTIAAVQEFFKVFLFHFNCLC